MVVVADMHPSVGKISSLAEFNPFPGRDERPIFAVIKNADDCELTTENCFGTWKSQRRRAHTLSCSRRATAAGLKCDRHQISREETPMATRLCWLGHACLWLESDGQKLLIDPFLSGNPTAVKKPDELAPDYILVSHGHGDHVGDTVAIARRTGATVICNYEISEWLHKQGIKNAHGMQHGGGHDFGFGRVKLTLAFHGSALPDGSNGGNPCGFLLTFKDGKRVYDAADTGLFGDMRLIGEEGLDLAILPIGDNYTMGPEDAVRAVKLLQPRRVLPIHYNTFPLIAQDASAWSAKVREQTQAEPVVIEPGKWMEV
jgi:L-ascorbate metabolism protein UlaG (beta-lactamase superfamily)